MALDFKHSGETSVGTFSPERAKEAVNGQFGSLGLSDKALKHIAQALDNGGSITGKKFNDIIDEAKEQGLFDEWKAEKIKDDVNLPDNYNKHWQ